VPDSTGPADRGLRNVGGEPTQGLARPRRRLRRAGWAGRSSQTLPRVANRVPRQEEYIARVPAIAILPWFLAGALFPITALPGFLTWVAKFLPLTHGLALMRYGLLQDASGLHAIWGQGSTTTMAALSLAVVGGFAVLLTAASIRVFSRSAVR